MDFQVTENAITGIQGSYNGKDGMCIVVCDRNGGIKLVMFHKNQLISRQTIPCDFDYIAHLKALPNNFNKDPAIIQSDEIKEENEESNDNNNQVSGNRYFVVLSGFNMHVLDIYGSKIYVFCFFFCVLFGFFFLENDFFFDTKNRQKVKKQKKI